ncbi:MAG: hypothetical protein H6767_03240 [Candidatus Peribacteria bacterium]|nr:MAG: hypothetical protein H6767_03240 [Candidatus Peribacteria bacterium]
MLLPFMKKKSETITKPFLKFLSYVHARVGIKKILQYTTTLIQILDRDPKTALEIMARFDDPKNSFVLSDLERLETMKQRHAELLHDGKERSLGGNYYIDSEDSLLGE